MNTDKMTELLVALHQGLPRLGPGNAESTLRALSLCEDLPAAPDVLDIGCGAGVQTLILASAIDGRITATDLFGQFLTALDQAAAEQGLEGRIRTRQADMRDLPFPDGSFDLIWSEGAAYVMGFDQALSGWRRLARPGGYLVVSELSWFKPDPPPEIKEFWDLNYPAMRGVDANLAAARAAGWMPVASFHLPAEAWTRDYYGPLRGRIPDFRKAHAGDADAQTVADMTEQEMDIMGRYADFCGYAFYVLRRVESSQGQGVTSH